MFYDAFGLLVYLSMPSRMVLSAYSFRPVLQVITSTVSVYMVYFMVPAQCCNIKQCLSRQIR
jgi:hypothetical protein